MISCTRRLSALLARASLIACFVACVVLTIAHFILPTQRLLNGRLHLSLVCVVRPCLAHHTSRRLCGTIAHCIILALRLFIALLHSSPVCIARLCLAHRMSCCLCGNIVHCMILARRLFNALLHSFLSVLLACASLVACLDACVVIPITAWFSLIACLVIYCSSRLPSSLACASPIAFPNTHCTCCLW